MGQRYHRCHEGVKTSQRPRTHASPRRQLQARASMKFQRSSYHATRSRLAFTSDFRAHIKERSRPRSHACPFSHGVKPAASRSAGHAPHTFTPSHAHALTRSRLDAHALTRSRLDAHATASRPHALTPRISRVHAHRHSNVSYAQTFWSDLRRRRHAGDAQATGPAALLLVGGYCGAGAWLGAGSSGQDEAVPNQVLKPDVPPSTCSVAASVLPPAKAMLTSCHELPVGCLGTQQPACL